MKRRDLFKGAFAVLAAVLGEPVLRLLPKSKTVPKRDTDLTLSWMKQTFGRFKQLNRGLPDTIYVSSRRFDEIVDKFHPEHMRNFPTLKFLTAKIESREYVSDAVMVFVRDDWNRAKRYSVAVRIGEELDLG